MNFMDYIEKYGTLIYEKMKTIGKFAVILSLIYFGAQWLFKYIIIPILILFTSKQICLLSGNDWATRINIFYLISAWVLLLYIVNRFLDYFFIKIDK